MKPMTEKIKSDIAKYIKNGIDISDLIEGVDIKGQDLSCSSIKRIKRSFEELTDINFTNCKIGEPNSINYLTGCNISRCSFKGVIVEGELHLKRVKAHNYNFAEAYLPYVKYQHGDFTGSNFCDAFIRMGSRVGHSAKIPKEQIEKWGIILT